MTTKTFPVLKGVQAAASAPDSDVWLSASAGTGKTFVLKSRVLRLLLRPGVRPDSILCLTFTRAGAAEMAERVHSDIASWVRMSGPDLSKALFALGEPNAPDDIVRARTLFAQVLEARGGGLRVMTIHAFCQTLLGSFPLEAAMAPGFRAIEGREQAALASRVLGELATDAEREGDSRLIEALRTLSRRLGEDGAQSLLLRAARGLDALEALPDGIEARVRRALDVPADFDASHLPGLCGDDVIDRAGLLDLIRMHREWGTATGDKSADAIEAWLAAHPDERAGSLRALEAAWATKQRVLAARGPKHPEYQPLAERLHAWCVELHGIGQRAELATAIAHALHAGRRYARAYDDAKRAAGLVDFDDLIARAVTLLTTPGMGDWIRYKLDLATDHILVDESQDTNQRQWAIVDALADEFWAGEGAREGVARTLFTVGDFKQAIFGFQGTDPQHYLNARDHFEAKAQGAQRPISRYALTESFRSTPPVLAVVDALLGELGPEALGIDEAEPHASARGGPGSVTLLPPVRVEQGDDIDDAEENWVADEVRELASRIARQVRAWIDAGHVLQSRGRAVKPGDVMILVRRRGTLAALLVARLQQERVPVAGVDRLRLSVPLAVRDCMAALRFAVQPDDDLTLAALLVSPILGWTQQQLYDVAHGRKGSLWSAVRDGGAPQPLTQLLRMADYVSPFVFLETMLSGAIGGRARLLARLGNEARDPIDELLNAALAYEREGVATLQGFIDWFDRGDSEIVREAGGAGDAVRVMTVHAAKGLEAPIVILADATADPEAAGDRDFTWVIDELTLPLFRPRASERALVVSLEAAAIESAARGLREHWRLLYVAMTRAEEQLVIAGSLGARAKAVPELSWHAAVERALARLDAPLLDDPMWGSTRVHAVAGARAAKPVPAPAIAPVVERPAWLDRPAPPEARPPRPLAPSMLGEDLEGEAPVAPAVADAAVRGRLMHALFERLPALSAKERRPAAERWLRDAAGVADAAVRDSLTQAVLGIVENPAFAALFAADGMAEVPIAGVVDGVVVSGTVDRLTIAADRVEIVDFKTMRRVPATPGAVPVAHLQQMAAYAAVLQGVFPDRTVVASLLYTAGPTLHRLTAEALAAHKPGFATGEQELGAGG